MSGGGSRKALGAFQTGLHPIHEDAGASSGLLDDLRSALESPDVVEIR